MAGRSDIPFNVSILNLTPEVLGKMKPVTSLGIFDSSQTSFDESGLFSVSIFGKMGDDKRSLRFSFINLNISIFHPVVFRALLQCKRLYGGIMASTEYAIWNPVEKDFERSTPIDGRTGYFFFLEHWKEIEYGKAESVTREQNVALIKKYTDVAMTDKMLVMPAGVRDVEVEDGRVRMDDLNEHYLRAISISNTITNAGLKHNPEIINTARYNLQLTFNRLYEAIENMVQGKKKLLMGKWASRRIMNGTRNVITAMNTSIPYLGAPGALGFNHSIIGLYQMMKAAMPRARHFIRYGFLSQVFLEVSAPAYLVNKETLKSEQVTLRSQYFDRWMTDEGIEKVITSFSDEDLRHRPLEIEGRYMGLIYKGPDGTFKLLHDIDDLPKDRSREHVYPMTFCELLYCSTYNKLQDLPLFITRYPVTGVGSLVTGCAYVRTTTRSEVRRELDYNWEPMDDEHVAREFPIINTPFVNSVSPHSSRLAGLGADFDGDTVSANCTYSDEAIAELQTHLRTKKAYVGTNGKFLHSTSVSTVSLVLFNLTG
jgi:hypothetical protein